MKKIGAITLGREVRVTDPCYEYNFDLCADTLLIKPGKYNCYSEITDGRVQTIILELDGYDYSKLKFSPVTSICVDSGQVGVFDFDYYKTNQPDSEWYDRCAQITINGECNDTMDDKGFVTESGWGDGWYTVHSAEDINNDTISIKIKFF